MNRLRLFAALLLIGMSSVPLSMDRAEIAVLSALLSLVWVLGTRPPRRAAIISLMELRGIQRRMRRP